MTTRPATRLAAAATAALLLAGCATRDAPEGTAGPVPSAAGTSPAGFPVTVDVCGTPVTVTRPPAKAVTNDVNTFADMVALGLVDRMAGTFALDGYGPDGRGPVPTELAAAYAAVPVLSKEPVTLEPLVGSGADFLFAGWNYGLEVGSTLTPQNLGRYGITTLVLSESCAHVRRDKKAASLADTYTDLRSLGAVFGVPQRAQALVAQMERDVADVGRRVAGRPRRSVFVYDSGTDAPFTAPGLAMPDALIAAAGGRNVFHDLRRSWSAVSWEQVVAADPDCVVVVDYGTPTAAQKLAFLRQGPKTRSLRALRSGCTVALGYAELTPSSLNARAVSTLARTLHPDAMR